MKKKIEIAVFWINIENPFNLGVPVSRREIYEK